MLVREILMNRSRGILSPFICSRIHDHLIFVSYSFRTLGINVYNKRERNNKQFIELVKFLKVLRNEKELQTVFSFYAIFSKKVIFNFFLPKENVDIVFLKNKIVHPRLLFILISINIIFFKNNGQYVI